MNVKTIKRILYGVLAAVFLVLAGRELLASGLTVSSAIPGAVGMVFLFSAVTGAG